MNESILTKTFLSRVGVEGGIIGLITLLAFFLGYRTGDARLASTMAFAVLCLSRLVHGYNCKSKSPVLFKKQFFNNKYMQYAFAVGFVLVTLVLTVPALQGLFAVRTLNLTQLLMVYGLALLNLSVIQGIKALCRQK